MTEDIKPNKRRKDPRIEKEYFEEIEVTDPLTGKKIKQKVKITRYRATGSNPVGNKGISEELEDDFEATWGEIDHDED